MEWVTEWWKTPIAADVHQYLMSKEDHMRIFYAQSPQLGSRRYLVDWLAIICDRKELSATAKNLAVTLLDYFMDHYDIEEEQLRLVALGALLLAAKFEEQEVKIPRASELNKLVVPKSYTLTEYMNMELALMDFFKWNIGFSTPAHFSSYFLTEAAQPSDSIGNKPLTDPDKVKLYLEKYTSYFQEICLQDHNYRFYRPSLLAAACVFCSRVCLRISPTWSPALQELTRYTVNDMQIIAQSLFRTYEIDEAKTHSAKETPPSTPTHHQGTCSHCGSPYASPYASTETSGMAGKMVDTSTTTWCTHTPASCCTCYTFAAGRLS